MANRFREEALKRGSELDSEELDEYLKKLLQNCKESLNIPGERSAEDALMYSTLFQNYSLKMMK